MKPWTVLLPGVLVIACHGETERSDDGPLPTSADMPSTPTLGAVPSAPASARPGSPGPAASGDAPVAELPSTAAAPAPTPAPPNPDPVGMGLPTPGATASGGAGGDAQGGAAATSSSGTGGAVAGGAPPSGAGTGGSADGVSGAAGVSGAGGFGGTDEMSMSFFVTSTGMGDGGNLGGLEGADAFCLELASAVDPSLGSKTWRAYLSTAEVDARDRIGMGPWRNAELRIVANDVVALHQQEEGEALDGTWPPGDTGIALDENGDALENAVHDVLTGSLVDGTLAAGLTCGDWTSNSDSDSGQVGHSNRTGGGRPPYFNATHEVGCAQGSDNYEAGSVTQGGGRGSFYCFAAD